MKTCSKCGGAGPFNKSSANLDGLQRWCRACQKKAFAASYTLLGHARDDRTILEAAIEYLCRRQQQQTGS